MGPKLLVEALRSSKEQYIPLSRAKHGSDSETFTRSGNFNDKNFEEMFKWVTCSGPVDPPAHTYESGISTATEPTPTGRTMIA